MRIEARYVVEAADFSGGIITKSEKVLDWRTFLIDAKGYAETEARYLQSKNPKIVVYLRELPIDIDTGEVVRINSPAKMKQEAKRLGIPNEWEKASRIMTICRPQKIVMYTIKETKQPASLPLDKYTREEIDAKLEADGAELPLLVTFDNMEIAEIDYYWKENEE